MKSKFTFLLICLYLTSSAQTRFENVYWDSFSDNANSIIQTSDSCFVLASVGAFTKIDSTGTVKWRKGLINNVGFKKLFALNDGGFVAAGSIDSSNYRLDFLMARIDANGQVLWAQSYDAHDRDYLYHIIQSADGGFIAVGNTENEISILKTDSMGNLISYREFMPPNASGLPYAFDLSEAGDSNLCFLYYYASHAAPHGIWRIAKLNSSANIISAYEFSVIQPRSVLHMPDNSFIFAGTQLDSFAGLNISNLSILKTDSLFQPVWTKSKIATENQVLTPYKTIRTSSDQFTVLSGYSYIPSNSDAQPYLTSFDTSGNLQWTRKYPGTLYLMGDAITSYDHGLLTWSHITDQNLTKTLLIKTDSVGNALCSDSAVNWNFHDTSATLQPVVIADTSFIITQKNESIFDTAQFNMIDYCALISNLEIEKNLTVQVFPNPAGEYVRIELNNQSNETYNLKIFNSLGSVVTNRSFRNDKLLLNIHDLAEGIYFLNLSDKSSQFKTIKLIVLH